MKPDDLLKIARLIGYIGFVKVKLVFIDHPGGLRSFHPETDKGQMWEVFEWLSAHGRFIGLLKTSVKYSYKTKCFLGEGDGISKSILSIALQLANERLENS